MPMIGPWQRVLCEGLGAMLLASTVVGSGIAGETLSGGNAGVALLANAGATACMLFVLVTALGPISGAHLNPAVTLTFVLGRELSWQLAAAYVIAQLVGCVAGVGLAHVMFDLPLLESSTHERSGLGQIVSEGAATFALVLTILVVRVVRPSSVPAAVALVIAAGYWWTASTSFANPAITFARAFTDSFAGIRPIDVPLFVMSQIAGAAMAVAVARFIVPNRRQAT